MTEENADCYILKVVNRRSKRLFSLSDLQAQETRWFSSWDELFEVLQEKNLLKEVALVNKSS